MAVAQVSASRSDESAREFDGPTAEIAPASFGHHALQRARRGRIAFDRAEAMDTFNSDVSIFSMAAPALSKPKRVR